MVKEVNKEHKNVEMTRKKKRSGIVYFDYSLLAILICLVCFGLVMLYSTSSYSAMMKQNGDSLFYFKRQFLKRQYSNKQRQQNRLRIHQK